MKVFSIEIAIQHDKLFVMTLSRFLGRPLAVSILVLSVVLIASIQYLTKRTADIGNTSTAAVVQVNSAQKCYETCVNSNDPDVLQINGGPLLPNTCFACSGDSNPYVDGGPCYRNSGESDTPRQICCEELCGFENGFGCTATDRPAEIRNNCPVACSDADDLGLACSDIDCTDFGLNRRHCGTDNCQCCIEDVYLIGSNQGCCNGESPAAKRCMNDNNCGDPGLCIFMIATGSTLPFDIDTSGPFTTQHNCPPNDPACGHCVQVQGVAGSRGCSLSTGESEIVIDNDDRCVYESATCELEPVIPCGSAGDQQCGGDCQDYYYCASLPGDAGCECRREGSDGGTYSGTTGGTSTGGQTGGEIGGLTGGTSGGTSGGTDGGTSGGTTGGNTTGGTTGDPPPPSSSSTSSISSSLSSNSSSIDRCPTMYCPCGCANSLCKFPCPSSSSQSFTSSSSSSSSTFSSSASFSSPGSSSATSFSSSVSSSSSVSTSFSFSSSLSSSSRSVSSTSFSFSFSFSFSSSYSSSHSSFVFSSNSSSFSFNECSADTCVAFGDDFCAVQGRECEVTTSQPCFVCVEGFASSSQQNSSSSLIVVVDNFCGDGILQHPEECDDGNPFEGDGCTVFCRIETCVDDFECPNGVCLSGRCAHSSASSVSVNYCGNGVLDPGEQCDDGNNRPNDGCSASCVFDGPGCTTDLECASGRCINGSCYPCITDDECAYGRCTDNQCQTPTIVAAATLCGNGVLETPEECDDGNIRDNDGCTSTCLLEVGICGDGIVQKLLGEQCESSTHNSSLGYKCVHCRFASTTCGNGVLDPGEECDLGQQNSTSPNAQCRPDCSRSRCGDAILDTTELCDDGNKLSGDGCDQFCRNEGANGQTQIASLFGNQTITFPSQNSTQPLPFQLPLANLQPLIQSQGPVGDTGPAAVAVIGAGAASGIAWVRRKRRNNGMYKNLKL